DRRRPGRVRLRLPAPRGHVRPGHVRRRARRPVRGRPGQDHGWQPRRAHERRGARLMELEFTEDQLELRDNVRDVLEGICPRSLVRAVYEGHDDAGAQVVGLWQQMVELYWPGVAIAEDQGGLGLGYVELDILAAELGRATAPGPFLATVTQFAPLVREAGDAGSASRFLSAVAGGGRTGTIAGAEGDRWERDAVRTTAERTAGGWVLDGDKTSVLDGASADDVAV